MTKNAGGSVTLHPISALIHSKKETFHAGVLNAVAGRLLFFMN